MWIRFHKCYSGLIRRGVSRLKTGSSFSFSILPSSASATSERPEAARRRCTAQTQDVLFLQIGEKAVHVTEPQVCGSPHCSSVLTQSSLVMSFSKRATLGLLELKGALPACLPVPVPDFIH